MVVAEQDPGWAQMVIDGNLVTFDTTRYRGSDGQPVVRVHYDGRITVGPVDYGDMPSWYGARRAMEPWTPEGPHGQLSRSPVTVLGVVVDPATRRRVKPG